MMFPLRAHMPSATPTRTAPSEPPIMLLGEDFEREVEAAKLGDYFEKVEELVEDKPSGRRTRSGKRPHKR